MILSVKSQNEVRREERRGSVALHYAPPDIVRTIYSTYSVHVRTQPFYMFTILLNMMYHISCSLYYNNY